ncbi:MAG: class I SAM-dependent methyltransferase [Phycisphaerales bacterium]|nr:MAG: class I SAM-dependent methyltransferase [Phycisphaerales bacterium]
MTGESIFRALPCDCCGSSRWEYKFSEGGFDLGRCAECGLHYIAQMPTQEGRMMEMEHRRFGANRRVIDAGLQRDEETRYRGRFQHYVELARRFAPPGKWLDVGCGTGTLIGLVEELDIDIEGIELTPDRREAARRLTGATIYDRPIEALDLAEESFAVVTLTNVFSHLVSPARTFSHIRRLLRMGGVLLLATSEIGPGVARHHDYSWYLGDHLYFLGDHTIERYADNLGFQLVYREKKWAPDLLYRRQRFLTKGGSALRNVIKGACVYTPGVLPLLRLYMLKVRNRKNPHYVSTLLLKKVPVRQPGQIREPARVKDGPVAGRIIETAGRAPKPDDAVRSKPNS